MSNEWYERGELPPAGTECEYLGLNETWHRGVIAAHVQEGGVISCIIQADDMWTFASSSYDFRPLKSDREKAIEAALSCDCEPIEGMLSRHDFCGALYDAGMLRLPENKNE